ncbi:helix-turn-helix domain-containing protein [Streptomyces sp. NPDC002104]
MRIPSDRGAGAILAQYLRSLAAHGQECTPAELEQLNSIAVDLAGACLAARDGGADAGDGPSGAEVELPGRGAEPPGAEPSVVELPGVELPGVELPGAEPSGAARTRALLARIDIFIGHNLGDPELSPSVVAARHRISLRRLQLLFQERGESVAAAIRRRRLERCHEDLADPGQLAVPVHTVALRWGFTRASVFSRLFRDTYGASPSAFRRAAVRSAPLPAAKPVARIVNSPCTRRTPGRAEPS